MKIRLRPKEQANFITLFSFLRINIPSLKVHAGSRSSMGLQNNKSSSHASSFNLQELHFIAKLHALFLLVEHKNIIWWKPIPKFEQ